MTFTEVLQEGLSLIENYKIRANSLTRAEVQEIRDKLSAICVTLSVYRSDFYDDYIGAEMKRKLFEAKESDKLLDSGVAANKSAIKAKIAAENHYINEVECEKLFRRAAALSDSWNQVLNTLASRLNEKHS